MDQVRGESGPDSRSAFQRRSPREWRRAPRLDRRKDRRLDPRSRTPAPEVTRHAGDGLMKTREANRKKLADTEKRDAGPDPVAEGS